MANADFTIADVLAWARTKPADEAYDYQSSTNCALCQFLRETGRAEQPSVDPFVWSDSAKRLSAERKIPDGIDDAVIGTGEALRGCPIAVRWTFGKLTRRLEKLCPETPVNASNWAAIGTYLEHIDPELVQ